jgi:hypothetical protein
MAQLVQVPESQVSQGEGQSWQVLLSAYLPLPQISTHIWVWLSKMVKPSYETLIYCK